MVEREFTQNFTMNLGNLILAGQTGLTGPTGKTAPKGTTGQIDPNCLNGPNGMIGPMLVVVDFLKSLSSSFKTL